MVEVVVVEFVYDYFVGFGVDEGVEDFVVVEYVD